MYGSLLNRTSNLKVLELLDATLGVRVFIIGVTLSDVILRTNLEALVFNPVSCPLACVVGDSRPDKPGR